MPTRVQISSFVAFTIGLWLLILWAQGEPVLSARFLQPFSAVVGAVVVVVLFFNFVAWPWAIWRGWYVNRPDLRGTWRVTLRSNWNADRIGAEVTEVEAYAVIRQSLTTLSIRLLTSESRSQLVAHSIELEPDGLYRVAGVFRNEPRVELQGVRSEIHHGALLLEVHGTPPTSLEGHYWTDRMTRGSMAFSGRRRELASAFADARAMFSTTGHPMDQPAGA